MKKNFFTILSLVLVFGIILTGCGNSAKKDSTDTTENMVENTSDSISQGVMKFHLPRSRLPRKRLVLFIIQSRTGFSCSIRTQRCLLNILL